MLNENSSTPPRRSERVLLKIRIRVEGKDTLDNPIDETTHTLVVNRSGGLIVVPHSLRPGSVITITNLANKISCPFEVVMRSARSLSGTPEWGVKCLEPEVDIWGVHFPAAQEGPPPSPLVHVLLECPECFSREMAALSMERYRELVGLSWLSRRCPKCNVIRDWKFADVEVELEEAIPSLPGAIGPAGPSEDAKRHEKRRAVKLPLGVRLPGGGEAPSTTENISSSILCFACDLEMYVGQSVYVKVGLDNPADQQEIPARIMWRRPAGDKGRAFYGAKLEEE